MLNDEIEAANQLSQLARDNDQNKQIIVEKDGVSPLLKLLKDSGSVEVQMAAGTMLLYLAKDKERVRAIVNEQGVSIIAMNLHVSLLIKYHFSISFFR